MSNTDKNLTDVFNLELFFELSPDLICIAGYDGFFKRINPTVSKILGYTNAELFARPINEFVHPDDQDITAGNRENLKKNTPLLNFENRYITKTGEIVWLSWTSMPIDSEKVVFAIAKNITHKRKLEDDRNSHLANLTKINNDLKQLTYTTSHDLRSPVNNLLSIFSFLDLSKIQDEETIEFINMLRSAAEDLKATLNNYVDVLSQKDGLNIDVEEVDLKECLDAILYSLRSLIQDSRAGINIDFSEAGKIKFNKSYLESIFLNLITNSIKYARTDLAPVITIQSKVENGVSQLIFTDNGMGFDMEKVKNRIFGFNQKFHDHGDSKGIGLYLVYNHVTSLGGQIAFESGVNKGTRFTISFKDF
ncbi:MAG TPA: PAS domain-containing sensor histidine kinase [Mucilaginibacter sp.]